MTNPTEAGKAGVWPRGWPSGDLPLSRAANRCKCGHAKSAHGDDPDLDGYNVCDSETCPCEGYRP